MSTPTPPQPPIPQPQSPGRSPQPPRNNRGAVLVIAVVVALLAGIAVGYAIFGAGSGKDDNLDRACQLHEDLADVDFFGDDGPGIEDAEFWELQGLAIMVTAHGYDVDDEDIVEIGETLQRSLSSFDDDTFDSAYDQLGDLC